MTTRLQLSGQADDFLTSQFVQGGTDLGNAFAGIHSREDAVQNWNWYCVPPVVANAVDIRVNPFVPSHSVPTLGVILPWYYVQAATLPERTINSTSIQRNGHAKHYPESYAVDDLTLNLFMDSSNRARLWAKAWMSQVLSSRNSRDPVYQGEWGLPAEYKKDISFFVTSVTGKILLHLKYVGCWPKGINGLDLESTSATPLSCQVVLAVEDCYVTAANEVSVGDGAIAAGAAVSIAALNGTETYNFGSIL